MLKRIFAYRVFLSIGFVLFGIAAFTPINHDVIVRSHPIHEFDFIQIPNYGLVSGIFYVNLIFISIPISIGYYGKGFIAHFGIFLFGLLSFLILIVGAELSVFSFGGPISGSTDYGIHFLILGNVFLCFGAVLTVNQRPPEYE